MQRPNYLPILLENLYEDFNIANLISTPQQEHERNLQIARQNLSLKVLEMRLQIPDIQIKTNRDCPNDLLL